MSQMSLACADASEASHAALKFAGGVCRCGGGAIYSHAYGVSVLIRNSILVNNKGYYGGAISMYMGYSLTIINTTILNNTVEDFDGSFNWQFRVGDSNGHGGGIWIRKLNTFTMINFSIILYKIIYNFL